MTTKPKAYIVVRHTSIPRKTDPTDSIELEPGSIVTEADVPKRINIALLVKRGAWKPEKGGKA
ncbi:MAG: hypothetical protein ACRDGB_14530 [Candidatus Limnocylindria bacterium]